MMKQILFAGVIGLFLTLIGTPLLIKLLARKGYGQYIRDDGPREHASKRGTPTMGGIASSSRRSPRTSCRSSSPASRRPTRVCWCWA